MEEKSKMNGAPIPDEQDGFIIPVTGPVGENEGHFTEWPAQEEAGARKKAGPENQIKPAEKEGHRDTAGTEKKDEAADYLDHLRRLQAEFANYRKRVQKEQEFTSDYAKGNVIALLLPVLDNFERVAEHHKKEEKWNPEGVEMVYHQLKKILADEGLEEIHAEGEIFNPEIHEAVSTGETHPDLEDRIIEVWQKGYRYKNRTLRPVKVKVGKAASAGQKII